MTVSIVIKAWNEARHIGRAIESALAALTEHPGEIVVADCGSTDGTVAIAARYPVKVVQLANAGERSCGVSPQLGYQYSSGRYICLIDGDMALHPGFLREAIAFLEQRPDVAGVAGRIVERNIDNLEFSRRTHSVPTDLRAGEVDRLNGGGVFRRTALERAGYFTDRNLHSYEEFELAARLRASGWRLYRLDRPSVDHFGHTANGYLLLWRRLTSGYAFGIGETLRAAWEGRHLGTTLRGIRELRLWASVLVWWAAIAGLIVAPAAPWAAPAAVFAMPFLAMSLRYRSLRLGVYAVAAWQVHTLGLVIGVSRHRKDPAAWIDSRVLSEPRPTHEADADVQAEVA